MGAQGRSHGVTVRGDSVHQRHGEPAASGGEGTGKASWCNGYLNGVLRLSCIYR